MSNRYKGPIRSSLGPRRVAIEPLLSVIVPVLSVHVRLGDRGHREDLHESIPLLDPSVYPSPIRRRSTTGPEVRPGQS